MSSLSTTVRPGGTSSSVRESHYTRTLDRHAVVNTDNLLYGVYGAPTMRPPPRWDRRLSEASTQQDGCSGVVVVKLKDRRDPDVVQNCTICRQAGAGGNGRVQSCVDSRRPASDEVNDDDGLVQSHDRLDDNRQFDRY